MELCLWPHPYGFPTGARQYLFIREINTVTYERGDLIWLALDPEDFSGTSDDPLGYDRYPMEDHEALVEYNQGGVPVVSGAYFQPKYNFRWNLRLSDAKASQLKSIYDTQQVCWRTLQTDYAVTLLDGRLMLQENQPRTRAAIIGIEGSLPITPRGSVFSYPIFSIMLKRSSSEELLNRELDGVRAGTIEAVEMDYLSVDNDIAYNALNPDSGLPWWDGTNW